MSSLTTGAITGSITRAQAQDLDRTDPLAGFRDRYLPATDDVVAYLDGNSLGRPLAAIADSWQRFTHEQWAGRLIRGWSEGWMDLPELVGDELAAAALGAAPGQTIIADSTTVNFYKAMRAALNLRPGRTKIILDRDNFPTNRYVAESLARDLGLELVWLEPPIDGGVTPEAVAAVIDERTAVVTLSHIAYQSAFLADAPAITEVAHRAGALVVWDLCHSVGSVPLALDEWGADLAVGCTYKYLNGGPGAPAFCYVAARHLDTLTQPIQGWLGSVDPFLMGPTYAPAEGIRRFLSGTPPILGMLALQDMLALIEEAGIGAVRDKSVALTSYAVEVADELLAPLEVVLASPRDPDLRGGHVTLNHPLMREVTAVLWERDVIPDYRDPGGLRIGLSPLSTAFAEVRAGLESVRDVLVDLTA